MRSTAITPLEVARARDFLMSGPRATPPSWAAVRKTVAYLRQFAVRPMWRHERGPWRSWPKMKNPEIADA